MTITISKKIIFFLPLLLLMIILFTASSCDGGSSDNQTAKESDAVDAQQTTYDNNQKVPHYDYSPERDELIQIYNSRMQIVNTWTVFYPIGKPPTMCASRGFPIPYTTQLTNPQKVNKGDSTVNPSTVTSQAEPNGLYTGTTSATWVLCLRNGKLNPVYAEEEVHAYTYPVTINPDGSVQDSGQSSSVSVIINETKAAKNGK